MYNVIIYLIYQLRKEVQIMNDCEKCRDFDWCSGEELDSEACPVRSDTGLSVSLVGFTYEGIKNLHNRRNDDD